MARFEDIYDRFMSCRLSASEAAKWLGCLIGRFAHNGCVSRRRISRAVGSASGPAEPAPGSGG